MEKNTFEYTYSAKKQDEIEAIRKKYVPAEEDKMETLRKLDRSAERKGSMAGIALGVIGALVMGTGMSIVMVPDFYPYPIVGIILGLVGIALIASAYPVYKKITKAQRAKIAPQILALSEELLKSN